MIDMSVPIELRVADEAVKKTIYADIVNLPDPVKLSLTVRIFNSDDVGLYMKIDGYNGAWTFSTVNYGLLASGADAYKWLDQFGSRARPASETEETVIIRLRAYTDAGYTTLKWTYLASVTLKFIKSNDGSWTLDFNNNFDDGTVQGWAATGEAGQAGGYPTLAVATDYKLSNPYSLKMVQKCGSSDGMRARISKSFATPNRTNVFAIADIRLSEDNPSYVYHKYLQAKEEPTEKILVGLPYEGSVNQNLPRNRWIRLVFPLTKNTTVDVRFVHQLRAWALYYSYLWMDDFKIISKD